MSQHLRESLWRSCCLTAVLALPCLALANPACPAPVEVTAQHLYGAWRAEFENGTSVSLRLIKHPEYAEGVSGELVRGTVRAKVSGEVEDGVLHLEESLDGTRIAATWAGQFVEKSCGKEIKGSWKDHKDGTQRAFVLRKSAGWQ